MELEIGMKAPSFSLKNEKGERIKLASYKGKKVVLYFYPEDDTPACTKQACNISDNKSFFTKNNIEVLGISPNSILDHEKFSKKYNLNFTLLADPTMKTINDYGVWGEKVLYGRKYMGLKRTTFLINEKGIIDFIIKGVRTAIHTEQIKKAWKLT